MTNGLSMAANPSATPVNASNGPPNHRNQLVARGKGLSASQYTASELVT